MWPSPLSCLLVILLAGHSFASRSPNVRILQSMVGEDAAKWVDAVQVGRNLVEAMNTLAKVINESKGCQREQKNPVSCKELLQNGETESGVYTIYSDGSSAARPIKVYCDMETDGGGWLVFQRRRDGSQDFLLGWQRYATGFGNLSGEFWLGNRNLNLFTMAESNEMRIDMRDCDAETRFARYETFYVGSEVDKFPLTVGGFSGDAGDSLGGHNGHKFTTVDQDNDAYNANCASQFKGAWWYTACHSSNLNGLYLNGSHTTHADGVEWYHWRGHYYSLQFTEMKMRPLYTN